jgi:hypothetical protein
MNTKFKTLTKSSYIGIVLFFALLFNTSKSIGQEYYLYLKPLTQSVYPINDTSTNDSTVNSIFRVLTK